jgi:hypothetical protein
VSCGFWVTDELWEVGGLVSSPPIGVGDNPNYFNRQIGVGDNPDYFNRQIAVGDNPDYLTIIRRT